ncbi:hypothetical protein AAVH_04453 [Aphelenchoides avenae]|nr:hypothetical protein AAVH_04453 [Aphelenchus avenae]
MWHLPLALLALRYVVALQVSTEDYEQQELDMMESRRHAWYAGRNRSNATGDSDSTPSASSNETELADRRFGPAGRSHKQKTNELKQRIKESNDLCKAKRWNCNRSCYLLKLPGAQCREPAPTDRCFDVAIQYNYTGDLDAPFPHHLEALSRFPTCWASLAPLICAWYYRPCGTWRTLETSGISVHEFWQVYPYSSCERARAACKDVIELGGWPDFLNCDAHTPNLNRTLFGSGEGECKFMYDKIRAVGPSSCIQPLADLPKVHLYTSTLSSVLDACYMPCRTPNAKNSWILRCALLVSLALLVFAVYLVSSKLNKKRKNYRWNGLARASLTCALVNATAYYVLWTIFMMFESNTTCLANSEIRRPSSIERIDSCQVQSFVMHFLTLATYAHVALATLSLWKSDYDNDICVAAIAVIYLITAGVGWALPHFTGVGVDGVTGICHFGLRHGLHSVPGLLSVTASGAVLFAIIAYLAVFSTYRGSRTVREQELLDIRLRNLTQHQQNQHLLDGKNSPPVASIQPRTFVPLAITIIIVIAAPLLTIESMFPGFNESIERAHIKDSVR